MFESYITASEEETEFDFSLQTQESFLEYLDFALCTTEVVDREFSPVSHPSIYVEGIASKIHNKE